MTRMGIQAGQRRRALCNHRLRALGIVMGMFIVAVTALDCHSSRPMSSGHSVPTYVQLPGDSTHNVSIEELDSRVGFRFVLPSYLPGTMGGNYLAFDNEHNTGYFHYKEGRVLILLQVGSSATPQIEIYERPPAANEPERGLPSGEVIDISGVTVHCVLEPAASLGTPTPFPAGWPLKEIGDEEARHPQFSCYWDTDELYFDIHFRWEFTEPLPGLITSDMRDEAVKIVTSMIDDPYIP
jgi:hypothetical protein